MNIGLLQKMILVGLLAHGSLLCNVYGEDVEGSLANVLDRSRPLHERMEPLQELVDQRDREVRESMLRRVVSEADEDVAASAAALLMEHGGIPGEDLSKRLLEWSESNVRAVLGAARNASWIERGPEELLQAPRAILGQLDDRDSTSLTISATLLARAGHREDVDVIARAVQARPEVAGLWLAVGMLPRDEVPQAVLDLADQTFIREDVDRKVRVYAAASRSADNAAATTLFSNAVAEFLKEFSDVQVETLILDLHAGGDGAQRFGRFRTDLTLLAALRVGEPDIARAMTLQSLGVANESIQGVCHLIAASRWPDEWSQRARALLPPEKYANLVAFAVIENPSLQEWAQDEIGALTLEEKTNMLRSPGGLWVTFGSSMGVIMGH